MQTATWATFAEHKLYYISTIPKKFFKKNYQLLSAIIALPLAIEPLLGEINLFDTIKSRLSLPTLTLKLSTEYGSSSYTATKILWVHSIHQDIGVVALLLWICIVIIKPLCLFLTTLCFMSTPNILRSMVISFGIHW